ncbi:MAG: TetR/AcrR family transcriptional regulator [Candidatus Dactylopiibacterium sp.]|nr:TetR/AcrR family transcriptional regulator [Candidatus Dactylopiibacterium sp.]
MPTERPDTRQHILDCGQHLIAGKGFVAVGLAEILASAGVPKGSFYHYFASKEAFGVALLERYEAACTTRMAALDAEPGLTGAQRVLRSFEHWAQRQRGTDAAQHCLITKLGAEIADLSDAMRARMLAMTEAVLRQLAAHVAAGQADGSIANRQAPEALAQWLYQAWLGASLLAKLRRDDSPFASALARTDELLRTHAGPPA